MKDYMRLFPNAPVPSQQSTFPALTSLPCITMAVKELCSPSHPNTQMRTLAHLIIIDYFWIDKIKASVQQRLTKKWGLSGAGGSALLNTFVLG